MKSDVLISKNKAGIRNSTMSDKVKRNITGWLMMLPGCICFLIFVIQPMIVGIYLSFFETKGFDAVSFIGLQNYKDVWTIVKKVDRGMRKISKAQPRHARRTKVQPD